MNEIYRDNFLINQNIKKITIEPDATNADKTPNNGSAVHATSPNHSSIIITNDMLTQVLKVLLDKTNYVSSTD